MLAGRYVLGKKLGSGGMATVYEAHDELLDRAVAIKLLRSEVLAEATARQRFAAEARAAASLTHPHVVAVYDVSSGDEQPFIVMELVRGRTLQDVLDDGALEDAQVVAVGSQILLALHAAHRRGLVHRDVKPANVLLPGGVVPTRPEDLPGAKLADFGIAKATADATVGLTMVGQVIGTPKYLSPEQVKGERATHRSDLYATGVVLYEAFAGRPPFEQDSAVALALAHREDEPPPLDKIRPDLSPALVAVVHRALSKDPDQRPADANGMREHLIAAAAGASPGTQLLDSAAASTQMVAPAGPTAPIDRTRPAERSRPPTQTAPAAPPRSRRFGLWLVMVVLLGVLGLAAAQWLSNRTTPTDAPTDRASQAPAADEGDEEAGDSDQDQGGAAPAEPDQDAEEPAGDEGDDSDGGQDAPAPDPEPDPGEEAPPDDPEAPPEGEEPPASE
jgi:serine/threonine-protein kinase